MSYPSAMIAAMTLIPEQVEYTVQILVSDWLLIDATMDNHIQSAIAGSLGDEPDDWDGEPDAGASVAEPAVARLGDSIRRAGWTQIPGWPRDAEGFATWPAPRQTASLVLTGAQWALALSALHYWADVDDSTDDEAGAAKSRAIAAAVQARLAEQGWSVPTDGDR